MNAEDPEGAALLAVVEDRRVEYLESARAAEAAMERRDAAARAAVVHGVNRETVAGVAGISRGRLYQILGPRWPPNQSAKAR